MANQRVLISGPSLDDPGGVAHYYRSVLPFLEQQENLIVSYLPIGSFQSSGGVFHPLVDQLRFRRALSHGNPRLVHINPSLDLKSFLRDGFFARQVASRGTPLLVFFRAWFESFERWANILLLQRFFHWSYAKASHVLVLSERMKTQLDHWGYSGSIGLETTVVPDSCLDGFSLEKKLQLGDPTKELRILFMARVERGKGILETLESVLQLAAEAPGKITLTVAGEGTALPTVKELLSKASNSHTVRLAGYVQGKEKEQLLCGSHIFCMPSYSEGMPNAVLEAMAFGLPIITCPVGGLRDFFANGKMGLLAQPRDIPALKACLAHFLQFPEDVARMGRFNHHFATERFLASAAAARLGRYYKALL